MLDASERVSTQCSVRKSIIEAGPLAACAMTVTRRCEARQKDILAIREKLTLDVTSKNYDWSVPC